MKGKYVLKSVMALLALCGILSISRLSVEAAEIGEDVAVSDNEVKEQIIEESVDLESAAPVLRDIKFTYIDAPEFFTCNWTGHVEVIGENIEYCSGIKLEEVDNPLTIGSSTARCGGAHELNALLNIRKRGDTGYRITCIKIHGTDGKEYAYYPEVPWDKVKIAKECDCYHCREMLNMYDHKVDVYQQLPEKFKDMLVTFNDDNTVTISNSGSAQEYVFTREMGGPALIPRLDNFQFRVGRQSADNAYAVWCSMDYSHGDGDSYWNNIYKCRGGICDAVENHGIGVIVRNTDTYNENPYEERRVFMDVTYPDDERMAYRTITRPGNWVLDEIVMADVANPAVTYHYCAELPLGITNGTEIYTKGGIYAPYFADIYYQLPESMKGLGFSIGANGEEVQINDVITQQTKNFVSRLYTVALGRDAEEGGLNDWTNRLLTKQENAAQVARGFFFSDEFKNRNYSDEEFVELLYQTMFGRAGDEGGTQYWLTCLENGVSREYVYHGFAESQEFSELCSNYGLDRGSVTLSQYRDRNADATGFIARLYTKMLGRKFDEDGLEYWCKAYLTGEKSIEVIASDGFLHSEELKNMNLSNEEFVTRMYETFLNREPEEAGLNDWVGRLERGEETRDSLVYGFTNSREFGGLKAEYHLP